MRAVYTIWMGMRYKFGLAKIWKCIMNTDRSKQFIMHRVLPFWFRSTAVASLFPLAYSLDRLLFFVHLSRWIVFIIQYKVLSILSLLLVCACDGNAIDHTVVVFYVWFGFPVNALPLYFSFLLNYTRRASLHFAPKPFIQCIPIFRIWVEKGAFHYYMLVVFSSSHPVIQ